MKLKKRGQIELGADYTKLVAYIILAILLALAVFMAIRGIINAK
jgi:hypothetical protein